MQQVLQSLAELARDTSSAIIVVHHLRKRSADEFTQEVTIDRVRGSTAIVATMRSIIALDRPDPLSKAVRMSIIKSNLCAAPEPIGATIGDGVQFCEPPRKPKKATAVDQAKDFLLGRLQAGPVAATELYSDAEGCGISKTSLRKAKDELGVLALREGGAADRGRWVWSLPARAEQLDHAERQFKEAPEKDLFTG
jgi:hypothetical protein